MFNKKSFAKNPNYCSPIIKDEVINNDVEIVEEEVPKIEELTIEEEVPKIEELTIEEPIVKPKRKYVRKNKSV